MYDVFRCLRQSKQENLYTTLDIKGRVQHVLQISVHFSDFFLQIILSF